MAATDNDLPRAEDEALAREREEQGETQTEVRTADEVPAAAPAAAATPRDGIVEARRRFGGLDIPATLVGMLAAIAFAVIAAGIAVAATDEYGYQTGLKSAATDPSTGGLVGGIAILFVSFLIGGWAAGRMARYDGFRNGVTTALWALVLTAIFAGLSSWLGDEYDVFKNVNLPQWFTDDAFTTEAILTGAAAVLAMLVGGAIGGVLGARFHSRVDSTIVGVERTREEELAGVH